MAPTDEDAYEELLVLRAQDGDREALEELVDWWEPRLLRHAARLIGDHDAAADVMQEAWLAIVRGLRRLDDPARFRSWAYRIVGNKCVDWVRQRARGHANQLPLESEPADDDRPAHDRESEITALLEALARLPRERRALLAMFYVEDMSVREIADAFSLPEGTVKSRLFHARGELKQILDRRES